MISLPTKNRRQEREHSEIDVQIALKGTKQIGKRKKQYAQNVEFDFPSLEFTRDHNWTDLKQAVKWLKDHEENFPPYMRGLFTIQSVFGRVCFTCKHCPARLILGPNGQKLQVKTFENHHNHGRYTCRRTEIAFGVQYIAQNMKTMTFEQLRAVLTKKFGMTQKTMWYVMRKSLTKKPWNEIYKELQDKRYEVRTVGGSTIEGEIPSLILLISPNMVMENHKYGDMVCFDLTYNLVRQRSQKANNQWALGMFTGMGHNKQIILLGVCFMSSQTTEAFTFIFENFFEISNRQPKVFLTDQQLTMKYALMKLKAERKFSGHHILDNFHVLKTLKKKTSIECFELYKSIIRASNQKEFERLMKKLTKLETNDDVYRKFKDNVSMTCFSQVPARFLGFSCSSNRAEAINALVKRLVPRQTYVSILLTMLQILEGQLIQRAKSTKKEQKIYQDLFCDNRLAVVRRSLGRKVFQKFIGSYTQGMRHTVTPYSNQFDVFDGVHNFKVFHNFGRYRCECNAGEKTGLPCSHIFGVIAKDGKTPYMEYVNPRWVIPCQSAAVVAQEAMVGVKKMEGGKKEEVIREVPEEQEEDREEEGKRGQDEEDGDGEFDQEDLDVRP